MLKQRLKNKTGLFMAILMIAIMLISIPCNVAYAGAGYVTDNGHGTVTVSLISGTKKNGYYSSNARVKIQWDGFNSPGDAYGWSPVAFVGGIYFTNDWDAYLNPINRPRSIKKVFTGTYTGDSYDPENAHNFADGGTWNVKMNVADIPSGVKYIEWGAATTNDDVADYVGFDISSVVSVDGDVPTVTPYPQGTPSKGVNGTYYYKDNVTVNFTASDAKSGIQTLYVAPGSSAYSSYAGGNQSSFTQGVSSSSTTAFNAYAKDAVGNTSGAITTDTYYVDAAAPGVTAWQSSTSYGVTADITFDYSDADSGITGYAVTNSASTPATWTSISSQSGRQTVSVGSNGDYYIHVIDAVGHESCSSAVAVTYVDNIAPTTTAVITGTNSFGWYKDSANVSINANDVGSGLNNVYINGLAYDAKGATSYSRAYVASTEGANTYKHYANDISGNQSKEVVDTVNVDASNPINLSLTADTTKWTPGPLAVNVVAQDLFSGLGSLVIQKDTLNDINTIDNSTPLSSLTFNFVDYSVLAMAGQIDLQTTTMNITENGIYRLKAIDRVGHESYSYLTNGSGKGPDSPDPGPIIIIKIIDKSAPIVISEIIPSKIDGYTIPFNSWYDENSVLRLTATEGINESGLASLTCNSIAAAPSNDAEKRSMTRDYSMFASGLNHFSYFATDIATNSSSLTATDMLVDDTAPVIDSVTKDTSDWVKSDVGVNISCKATDSQSGLKRYELLYSTDGIIWTVYGTADLNGETASTEHIFNVTKNGKYKLRVYDQTAHITTDDDSKQIDVSNIDDTLPDGLDITPDTTAWVNESKGVDLTASAVDVGSGVKDITVLESLDSGISYGKVSTKSFELIKESNETDYETHWNARYKTSATDGVGHYKPMPEEDALNVPNIDPVVPELTTKVDSTLWANTVDGFPISVYAQDNESGLNSIKLQKLNASDVWEDTTLNYKVENYVKDEDKLTTYESNAAANFFNKTLLALNKQLASNTSSTSNTDIQGTNSKVKVVFNVPENGTYRVISDDIVANTSNSSSIVVNTVDANLPTIMVEGNPTDWTNKNATIKVTAKDNDSGIKSMALNGKSVDFKEVEGAYFFTFDVEENNLFTVSATDTAGNTATQEVNVTKIDKVNPCVNTSLSDWVSGTRNATVALSDSLSGIKTAYINNAAINITNDKLTTYTKDITAGSTYEIKLTDKAGNTVSQEVVETKELDSIKVTTPPDKTEYKTGSNFNKKGMVVTAYYTDGSNKVVTDYVITNGSKLPVDQTKINIKYTENKVTKKTSTPITVTDSSASNSDTNSGNDVTPTVTQKATQPVGSPKTGDDTNILIYVIVLVLALGGGLGCFVYVRKSRKNQLNNK